MPAHLWWLKPVQWLVLDINDWLFPLARLNLLWVLLCLTIVLLPPATAALFDMAYGAYGGIAPTTSAYFAHIRRRFWQSWVWAAANLLLFAGLFAMGRAAQANEIAVTIIGIIGALCIMAQFYFWPFVVIQGQPALLRALRNSAFTAAGGLMYLTLYMALSLLLLIPSLILIAPILLLTPVLLTMLAMFSLIAWLHHHKILDTEPREL